jgi:hypothetical protein
MRVLCKLYNRQYSLVNSPNRRASDFWASRPIIAVFDKVTKHGWDDIKYWIRSIDVKIANIVDALTIYRNLSRTRKPSYKVHYAEIYLKVQCSEIFRRIVYKIWDTVWKHLQGL